MGEQEPGHVRPPQVRETAFRVMDTSRDGKKNNMRPNIAIQQNMNSSLR